MPSPFPGMNPYLENSELWSGFHHLLIAALLELLAPQLEPKYIVAIERRIYEVIGENPLLVGIPDVMVQRPLNATNSTTNVAILSPPAQPITVTVPIPETIRQSYLEVRQVGTNQVVTSIEILSPVNKRSGKGRETYEAKRQNVLGSFTHLVEIDLLRQWEPMPILEQNIQIHYSGSRLDAVHFDLSPNLSPTRREALILTPLPLQGRGWGLGFSAVLHAIEKCYIAF